MITLLPLYVPRNSSFISTGFLVLNLDCLFFVLSKKFIIFINSIITYYYINLRSSIIFCLWSEELYLSLRTSSSFASGLFFCEVFEILVISSTILFAIESLVATAVFWIALFEVALTSFIVKCLAWSIRFWLNLLLTFLLIFLLIFLHIFLAKEKKIITFYKYSIF